MGSDMMTVRRCLAMMVQDLTRRFVAGEMSSFEYLARLWIVRDWATERAARQ